MIRKPLLVALHIILSILAMGSPVLAQGARYELFPEPEVRRTPTNLVNSAYVLDKKENQFWVCTARYDFSSKEDNKGECSRLANDIGRPSLTERYRGRAVVGSTMYGPLLPVIWFIEPTTGDVQFCALRAAGICVRMSLP
jgi:hypothetical protein